MTSRFLRGVLLKTRAITYYIVTPYAQYAVQLIPYNITQSIAVAAGTMTSAVCIVCRWFAHNSSSMSIIVRVVATARRQRKHVHSIHL